jgi:hypothetical protein|tara:strand:+ start:592 stop:951 length:360 start_codon:yes stop_codon:yes gene_type:complete
MSSELYIFFTDDDGHWWSRFLNKEIRHCFIVKPENGAYMVVSRQHDKVELAIWKNLIIGKSYRLLKFEQRPPVKSLFMLNTCTGLAKQLLGIDNPFILTPYQLYKYVRKHNGIHETESP